MEAVALEVKENMMMSGLIKREFHARRGLNGRIPVYLLEDKNKKVLLVSQKLSLLQQHINARIASDNTERVSVTGLSKTIFSIGRRMNGYTKFRFRVHPHGLEDGASAFESMRDGFECCVVIGNPACYNIIPK